MKKYSRAWVTSPSIRYPERVMRYISNPYLALWKAIPMVTTKCAFTERALLSVIPASVLNIGESEEYTRTAGFIGLCDTWIVR